eukprot:CAMPEP_0195522944 /NCGR_PEP_ID=MMETSP0794_2-20130614/21617_1 /TAXON_ID=515487 /ORGANISM="Stephanopyxis turris, Strain CCMP 815" /LENGTH=286 /DNA_ID=CAMNT_0040652827 /DNA_START=41 /DNA_END=901 /DNA_ORIENTATION=-
MNKILRQLLLASAIVGTASSEVMLRGRALQVDTGAQDGTPVFAPNPDSDPNSATLPVGVANTLPPGDGPDPNLSYTPPTSDVGPEGPGDDDDGEDVPGADPNADPESDDLPDQGGDDTIPGETPYADGGDPAANDNGVAPTAPADNFDPSGNGGDPSANDGLGDTGDDDAPSGGADGWTPPQDDGGEFSNPTPPPGMDDDDAIPGTDVDGVDDAGLGGQDVLPDDPDAPISGGNNQAPTPPPMFTPVDHGIIRTPPPPPDDLPIDEIVFVPNPENSPDEDLDIPLP